MAPSGSVLGLFRVRFGVLGGVGVGPGRDPSDFGDLQHPQAREQKRVGALQPPNPAAPVPPVLPENPPGGQMHPKDTVKDTETQSQSQQDAQMRE